MYEQPTAGRRFGPGLIVFLAVLALASGVAGYYGARRVLGLGAGDQGAAGQGGSSSDAPTTAASGSDPAQPAADEPDPIVAAGDPTRCPQATVQALTAKGLNGELTVLLYVEARAAGVSNAEVWVCQNADGLLIYQGHVLNGILDVADNARNTLLLAEGIKGSVVNTGDGFLATNPDGASSTEYAVSRDELTVRKQPAGAVIEDYTIVRAYP